METLRNIMLVAIGGGIGSALRYIISRMVTDTYPLGTLTVNLLGSLFIGLLAGLVSKGTLSNEIRLFLVTGFCGGFTTFSTFANESLSMLKAGDVMLTALYIGASIFVGIMAVYAGMLLSR